MHEDEGHWTWMEMETVKSVGPHPLSVAILGWMVIMAVILIAIWSN